MRKIEKQIDEYIEYCDKVRNLSQNTINFKRWTFDNFLSYTKINDIKRLSNKDINEWMSYQKQNGCIGSTINVRLSQIKALLSYYERQGVVFYKLNIKSVLKTQETPCRIKYYSAEQIERALECASFRVQLMIRLCYECGLRISELRNLKLDDISGRRILFIGKGAKNREVYFSEQTRKMLDSFISAENIVDYLWINKRGTKVGDVMRPSTIRYHMKRAFSEAGFDDFFPHALRHSFATNICDNGAPLPVAQKMLGHSRITTTERYVHSFDSHIKQYFDQYSFA